MGRKSKGDRNVRASRGAVKVAVTFKGLSATGKNRGSLAFNIDVEDTPQAGMDELFLNTEIDVVLSANPSSVKDHPGQQEMDVGAIRVATKAISRGYSKRETVFGCSIGFNKFEVAFDELKYLTGQQGYIQVSKIGDATHVPDEEDEEEEAED